MFPPRITRTLTSGRFSQVMLFRSSGVLGIAGDTLEFVFEACRDTHPDEFMGVLRGTDASRLGLDEKGSVITDVLVIPGTKSGNAMAQLREEMIPINSGGVGTVHSHPSGSARPSQEDLSTFRSKGKRHIIVAHPYGMDSWRCYDRDGSEVDLEVLDVEFEDDEFFAGDDFDLIGE